MWDVNVDEPSHATYYDHRQGRIRGRPPGGDTDVPVTAGRRILHSARYGAGFEDRSGRDLGQWRRAGQEPDRRPDPARRQAARPDRQDRRKVGVHRPDGKLYFIPTTLQGHVVYYNKKLYKDAGLDPNKPPTTWDEVKAMCDAIKAKGETACFMMANKEGYEAEFFLSEMANQSLTAQQQADWLAGKLHWSDPPIKAILQTWVDTPRTAGTRKAATRRPCSWTNSPCSSRAWRPTSGACSPTSPTGRFSRRTWASRMSASIRCPRRRSPADQHEGAPGVPLDGGVGYGVNKDSPNIDLAVDAVKDPRLVRSPVPPGQRFRRRSGKYRCRYLRH